MLAGVVTVVLEYRESNGTPTSSTAGMALEGILDTAKSIPKVHDSAEMGIQCIKVLFWYVYVYEPVFLNIRSQKPPSYGI